MLYCMRVFAPVWIAAVSAALAGLARADDPVDQPLPVPLTRPEMKQALEDLKERTPRIPLPELSEDEREQLGDRADSYEARLRYHYLPSTPDRGTPPPVAGSSTARSGGYGELGRDPDPNMSLDYGFKVQLFWIVSRTNNCLY